MKLMNKEIEERFKSIGSQEGKGKDAIVVLKIFNPAGSQTWYLTEYDSKDRLFFGFVSLFGGADDEWGYVSLDELESVKLPFGLTLERDLHFGAPKAGEVKAICMKMRWELPSNPIS